MSPRSSSSSSACDAGQLRRAPASRRAARARPAPRSRGGRPARPSPRSRAGCALERDRHVVRAHELLAEPAHRPDEPHHELVRRPVVDLARRADLLDRAGVHDRDPVGDLHRLLLVVGDEHGRHALLVVQPPQPGAQLGADGRVERAERLVEQQHLRLDRERAGQRHPLALAARELRAAAARAHFVSPTSVEQLVDARRISALRALADPQPEGDVLAHGHVRERRVVLEHEPDATLLRPARAVTSSPSISTGPGVGRLEPGDDPQQRRLARAARAQQRRQRPLGDLERDVVERGEVAEALGDGRRYRSSSGFVPPWSQQRSSRAARPAT